jgi:hypothetical protein
MQRLCLRSFVRVFLRDTDTLELAEPNSISYHFPAVFIEVLPRGRKLTLLLALISRKSTIRLASKKALQKRSSSSTSGMKAASP